MLGFGKQFGPTVYRAILGWSSVFGCVKESGDNLQSIESTSLRIIWVGFREHIQKHFPKASHDEMTNNGQR